MSLVIYTAVFGPRAKPLQAPLWSDPAVPMLCFTDQAMRVAPWQMIRLPTEPDPLRGNRRLKLLSHRTVSSQWSLYIDSNFRVLADPRPLMEQGDFSVHRHHFCANIVEESNAIVRSKKAPTELVRKQVKDYLAQGFCTADNPQINHSANGVLLRHHTPEVVALNESWWAELEKHSHRDQLSLDFCAWKAGVTLHHWPWTLLTNPFLQYVT